MRKEARKGKERKGKGKRGKREKTDRQTERNAQMYKMKRAAAARENV